MAELTQKERLQPSLLDRLTDDEPTVKQESREKRVLSPSRLRESVRRDLAWLLNTTNLNSVQSLEDQPEVAQSVLNYGIPALAGQTISGIDIQEIERALREAIWAFEPRLLRESVRVRMATQEGPTHNALSFYIEAQLWSQPIPLRLFFKTDIDLEAGSVAVTDMGGG